MTEEAEMLYQIYVSARVEGSLLKALTFIQWAISENPLNERYLHEMDETLALINTRKVSADFIVTGPYYEAEYKGRVIPISHYLAFSFFDDN